MYAIRSYYDRELPTSTWFPDARSCAPVHDFLWLCAAGGRMAVTDRQRHSLQILSAWRAERALVNRVTETFFLPDAVGRQAWTLPADIYNLSRTLLGRSEFNCTFVPIRSMQYLAIIIV